MAPEVVNHVTEKDAGSRDGGERIPHERKRRTRTATDGREALDDRKRQEEQQEQPVPFEECAPRP